jgi:hypothetical protein
MNMKRIWGLTMPSIVLALLALSSCATPKTSMEPSGATDTLVTGRLKLIGSNFPANWYMNGEITNNITIYIWDFYAEERRQVTTKGNYGVFYGTDFKPGNHAIVGFHLKRKMGGYIIEYGDNARPIRVFVVEKNAVNNLGDIVVEIPYKRQSKWNYLENFIEMEAWFKDKFSGSGWNTKTWISAAYRDLEE